MTKIVLLSLDPDKTFPNFICGSGSEFAHEAALQVAEAESGWASYNPFFLFGPSGVGKTHLLHAVGHLALERRPSLRVCLCSAQSWVGSLRDAPRDRELEALPSELKGADVFLFDDVGLLSGHERSQHVLAQLLRFLFDRRSRVVVTAGRYPRDLDLTPPLEELLGSGLMADIQPPDTETKVAMLRRWALDVTVPDDVAFFMARRFPSPRALRGAFETVLLRAGSGELSMALLVADPRCDEASIPPDVIMRKVADFFSLKVADLLSSSRLYPIVTARHAAMWLIRRSTLLSLPAIGRLFGGRDHTTVIHAVRKMDHRLASDPTFRRRLELLIQELELPISLDRLSA